MDSAISIKKTRESSLQLTDKIGLKKEAATRASRAQQGPSSLRKNSDVLIGTFRMYIYV